jgi:hypothetical protein
MRGVDFTALRTMFVTDVLAAVRPLVPAVDSGQHLRAVGFYGLYVTCDDVHLPNLTARLEPIDTAPPGRLDHYYWNPAEWSDDEPSFESAELRASVESLRHVEAPGSIETCEWLEPQLEDLLTQAAADVYSQLAGLPGVASELIVMYYDHDSDDLAGLVRRSVGPDRFRALFPA